MKYRHVHVHVATILFWIIPTWTSLLLWVHNNLNSVLHVYCIFTFTVVPGYLESVSNLTIVPVNSTTVLISWSPPFTLERIPILGYNVTIINTISGETNTIRINETFMKYPIGNVKNFIVIVVPFNEVGAGNAFKAMMESHFLCPSTSTCMFLFWCIGTFLSTRTRF